MANKVYPSFVDFRKGEGDQGAFGSLVGFVARDPQLRHTKTGKAVLNTAIPVNLAGKNFNYLLGSKFDENSQDAIFVEATAWEKQAELVEKSGMAKGDQVVVSGYLSLEEYEGKERVRLNISRFQILKRKNANGGGAAPADDPSDDLPF